MKPVRPGWRAGLVEAVRHRPEAPPRIRAWLSAPVWLKRDLRLRDHAPLAAAQGFDACMHSLRATGWLNFRMRAMLVNFAAYHLWLHWRGPGLFLAKQFLDFEPGMSQMQMQSGTTGINALRIYSPAKQARAEAAAVQQRHGSRKSGLPQAGMARRSSAPANPGQRELF